MKQTASIQSMAETLGLSKATVSKALNGYPQISEETRQRVLAHARQVGYQSTGGGRQGMPARRIAVVVEDYENEVPYSTNHYEVMMAFKQYAAKLGMEVILLGTTTQEQNAASYDAFLQERQLDGALVMGLRLDDPYYRQIHETQMPTVLWDLGFDNPKVACVSVDSVRGAEMATSHLLSLGNTRIGFLNGHRQAEVSYDRLSGYLLALSKAGIQSRDADVFYGDYTEKSGEEGADYFARTDVTAVFCASDQMALGLVKRMAVLGKRVPEDYAVVGYDDNVIAQISTPSLTTVNQNRTQIGETACALLNCIFEDIPIRNAVLRPTLVVRESCGQRLREREGE